MPMIQLIALLALVDCLVLLPSVAVPGLCRCVHETQHTAESRIEEPPISFRISSRSNAHLSEAGRDGRRGLSATR